MLEAALDLLLAAQERKRGIVEKPRTSPQPSTNPRYVPAEVQRAVCIRDGGCASGPFVGRHLRIPTRVELDHWSRWRAVANPPWAMGVCSVHCTTPSQRGRCWATNSWTTSPRVAGAEVCYRRRTRWCLRSRRSRSGPYLLAAGRRLPWPCRSRERPAGSRLRARGPRPAAGVEADLAESSPSAG